MGERFQGKLAVIAGGTGGLGRAVSEAFLAEGARVVVTYRNQQEFEQLKGAAGRRASLLEGRSVDVTDETAVGTLIQDVLLSNTEGMDFLVNAVGGYAGGIKLWELDNKTFETMIALNLRAGFMLCRAAAKQMLQQKRGAIVDVVAKAALDHAAGAAAYAASKAGALAMMDSLAADLKGTGVRVNSILPSIIDTEANRRAMPNADFTQWPKPEEIARVVLFLCSEDARVVYGAAIPVYGNS